MLHLSVRIKIVFRIQLEIIEFFKTGRLRLSGRDYDASSQYYLSEFTLTGSFFTYSVGLKSK